MDFIHSVKLLMHEICRTLPELKHIDLNRVWIAASLCRSRRMGGTVAYVFPYRFKGGTPVEVVKCRGKLYHYAYFPVVRDGVEILYSIHFMVPRFFNLKPFEKLETIVHELYHIHPDFNGDLRRFRGGRLHGPTKEHFQQVVKQLTKAFLVKNQSSLDLDFIRLRYRSFEKKHGSIPTSARPKGWQPRLLKVESVLTA